MKFQDSKLDREWLLRYVLGELSEDEMQKADAWFFADDAFATTLDEMYRDLLDAYAANEITGAEKQRVERAFFAETSHDAQMNILRALRSTPKNVVKLTPRVSVPSFRSFWPVAVSAGVLSFVVAFAFYHHRANLRPIATQNISTGDTVFRKAPEVPGAPPTAAASEENVYTILLLPNVSRGNGAGKSFSVPSSAAEIVFQIVLPTNQTSGILEVRLKGGGASETHVFSNLKARTIDTQRYVEFRFPSGDLPVADYVMDVFDPASPGRPREHFVFHVTR
jgi:hypothetical protein